MKRVAVDRCTLCGGGHGVAQCPWSEPWKKDRPEWINMETNELEQLRKRNACLLRALQAVCLELHGLQRPYSVDSYLPAHITDQVRAAIAGESDRSGNHCLPNCLRWIEGGDERLPHPVDTGL